MVWRSLTMLVAMTLAGSPLCASAQGPAAQAEPEASSGYRTRDAVSAQRMMVATANPHASRAGLEILDQGGSAVDAAIAVQMVLTLTEPQSSGIGGGAFLMAFDAHTRRIRAWDGRETAPRAASESLFIGPDGKPVAFFDAVVGGRSVGVPGVVRMLEAAHAQHGRLPWARLFEPAIRLATGGFEISSRLHRLLERDPHLRKDPLAAAYFYDAQGKVLPAGHQLRNPALADTLEQIARRGSLALHTGPIARDIVAAVRAHPTNPGLLGEHDLAFYQPLEREAICTPYRRFLVCGMPPPSSGGIAVAQILGILERTESPALYDRDGAPMAAGVHAFTEATRLAFADRNRFIADPEFVALPRGLLDPAYLRRRAALIGERSMGIAPHGDPDGIQRTQIEEFTLAQPATSHVSIIDAQGNAIAMTTTIEDAFGARLMVRGFLLNNQLTDFSFAPEDKGVAIANRVQPGKRPRSSMAPTLVFERITPGSRSTKAGTQSEADSIGPLVMSLGSPGGSQIIGYVARTLVAVLNDGLDIQRAISAPNLGSRNGPTELELNLTPSALLKPLRERGHDIRLIEMTSGLQGIVRQCDRAHRCTLQGGADPRREGLVVGR